jgi:hypothetical protein
MANIVLANLGSVNCSHCGTPIGEVSLSPNLLADLRTERARIRRELLEALPMECLTSGESYYKGWSAAAEAVRAALDNVCPEEE